MDIGSGRGRSRTEDDMDRLVIISVDAVLIALIVGSMLTAGHI
jgi:hypothetical protein